MGKKALLALAWGFALFGVGKVVYAFRETPPGDFMLYYFGGRLAGEGKIERLYQKSAYEPLVAELRERGDYINPINTAVGIYYFVRPAFAAYLYIPYTWFPYRTALALSVALNLILLGALVWKLPEWFPYQDFFGVGLFRACLFVFMPFTAAIGHGQDTLLLVLLAAGGIYLALRGNEFAAGFLLGCCAFKPHLLVAMPLVMLASGKRKMLFSFLGTGLALALWSFAAIGPQGVRDWFDLLRAPSTDFEPQAMGNLRALSLHFGFAAAAVATLLALACFGIVLRNASLAPQFSAAILVGLLVSPHTYRYDFSMLAIVSLLATHPAVRYVVLLPWLNLFPVLELLPMVFLSLGCLIAIAALSIRSGGTRKRPTDPQQAAGDRGPRRETDLFHFEATYTSPQWRSQPGGGDLRGMCYPDLSPRSGRLAVRI